MINKFPGFYFLILLIAGMTSWLSTNGQTGSTSPYSRYGIGDILSEGFTHQAGMGGLGAGIASPNFINFINPASYIADSMVIFDVGAMGEIRKLVKEGESSTLNSASFADLCLAFPIVKGKAGVAFGVLPISSVGYDIVVTTRNVPDIGTIEYQFEGDGGLNKFFIGTGVKILKNLNAGINVSYLFGTIDNVKSVEFPNSSYYFNSRYINAVTANGFTFDYGLLYEKTLKNKMVARAGLTGSISTKVNGENSQYYYNYTSTIFGGEIVKDSIFRETNKKGKIQLPQYWRAGVSIEKPGKYMVGLDFNYYNWSKFESFGVKDSLNNSYNLILGGQKFTNRFDYRMGFRFGTSYLNLNESTMHEYGVTVGLGVKKLLSKRPPSSVNVAFEFGQRGTTDNNLLKEQYFKFHLGFSLTDIWFVKPKYD